MRCLRLHVLHPTDLHCPTPFSIQLKQSLSFCITWRSSSKVFLADFKHFKSIWPSRLQHGHLRLTSPLDLSCSSYANSCNSLSSSLRGNKMLLIKEWMYILCLTFHLHVTISPSNQFVIIITPIRSGRSTKRGYFQYVDCILLNWYFPLISINLWIIPIADNTHLGSITIFHCYSNICYILLSYAYVSKIITDCNWKIITNVNLLESISLKYKRSMRASLWPIPILYSTFIDENQFKQFFHSIQGVEVRKKIPFFI